MIREENGLRRALGLASALAVCAGAAAAQTAPATTGAVIAEHNRAYLAGDRAGWLRGYADDAVFIGHGRIIHGAAELSAAAAQTSFPSPAQFHIDRLAIDGAVATETWTRDPGGPSLQHGQDVFIVRDGKIVVHVVEVWK